MASQNRSIKSGELFFWENNEAYTRVSGVLENDATIAGTAPDIAKETDLLGQPLILEGGIYRFADSAEVTAGALDGFALYGPALEVDLVADAVTDFEWAIITRGPALMNEGRIPATDVYGIAIVEADYIAAALALDIVSKALPPVTETQTT